MSKAKPSRRLFLTPRGRNKNHTITVDSDEREHQAGPQHDAKVSAEVGTGQQDPDLSPRGTTSQEAVEGGKVLLRPRARPPLENTFLPLRGWRRPQAGQF